MFLSMKSTKIKRGFISFIFLVSALTGCVTSSTGPRPGTASAAVSGGLMGAGAGAIVGALIKNGDIAKSALLGGGIGIPAGIALSLLLSSVDSEDPARIDRSPLIKQNEEKIYEIEKEISDLRERVVNESPDYDFEYADPRARIDGGVYNGVTQGNGFR